MIHVSCLTSVVSIHMSRRVVVKRAVGSAPRNVHDGPLKLIGSKHRLELSAMAGSVCLILLYLVKLTSCIIIALDEGGAQVYEIQKSIGLTYESDYRITPLGSGSSPVEMEVTFDCGGIESIEILKGKFSRRNELSVEENLRFLRVNLGFHFFCRGSDGAERHLSEVA